MRALALALLVAAGLLAVGCGSPSADLFVVERSGTVPGAKLTLLIGDGGTVRCNGGKQRDITSDDLIEARKVARELNGKDDEHPGPAASDTVLPPGPQSILRYEIRSQKGTVTFRDSSANQPEVFYRAAKFTRDIARRVCGLER